MEGPGRGRNVGRMAAFLLLMAVVFVRQCAAFEALDPTGNITIQWDVTDHTGDGYNVDVTMTNYQLFRSVDAPGWNLNWTWTERQIIWSMKGASTTTAGNCKGYVVPGGSAPFCCEPTPTVFDLPASSGGSLDGCCKGGVLGNYATNASFAVAKWQMVVGNASYDPIVMPNNFLFTNLNGYTCAPAINVQPPTSTDYGGHTVYSLETWRVICTYDPSVDVSPPACCVSLSAYYNSKVVPCPSCACACGNFSTSSQICDISGTPATPLLTSDGKRKKIVNNPTAMQCTSDGCPMSVHWHIVANSTTTWLAKVSIINRNYYTNYTNWQLVVEHPAFNNFTGPFSFNYSHQYPFGLNDTAVFWGQRYYNDILYPWVGREINVLSSELQFGHTDDFTLAKGWAFPRRVAFNGRECVMPATYPTWPKAAPRLLSRTTLLLAAPLGLLALLFVL